MHAWRGIEHRLLRLADWGRRHHIHAVAEHDGRGMSPARQFNFPADVFLLAPLAGRIGERRNAVPHRAAPLGPVAQTVRRRSRGADRHTGEKTDHEQSQQPAAEIWQGRPASKYCGSLEITHTRGDDSSFIYESRRDSGLSMPNSNHFPKRGADHFAVPIPSLCAGQTVEV